ncbi:MAG: peptidylprolyl isomerase [Candidatus Acidiferrales bacterium]
MRMEPVLSHQKSCRAEVSRLGWRSVRRLPGWLAACLLSGTLAAMLAAPSAVSAQDNGRLVEEIVARVNNEIITSSEYARAEQALREEITQSCNGCSPAQIDAAYNEQHKDILRGLIDQALLVQRAKDMGVSVETQLVKQLDQTRQQHNLPSMEALEKAVESSGISWEEYKASIRNNLMTQDVIRKEVGGRINLDEAELKKYYDAHKSEFVRPEQVYLSEILISTDGKSPDDYPALKKKAEDLLDRVKKGEDFGELAKRYSDGQTAKQGGDMGAFGRGQLAKSLEDQVFKMNRGDMTDVIQTKAGFEILRVEEHYQAGEQPYDKVEGEISNKFYQDKMQPALRSYLAELREESYLTIKPGYVDSAAVGGNSVIEEVAPTPDSTKKPAKPSKKKAG